MTDETSGPHKNLQWSLSDLISPAHHTSSTDPVYQCKPGASSWADQPVAAAARTGGVVVLDGAHRLPPGALVAALSRLCTERELDLPDGTRLVDDARCESGRVHKLARSFRLVALAEPGSWLSPEVAALFSTHTLPEMTLSELSSALQLLVPSATEKLCADVATVSSAALGAQSDSSFSRAERDLLRLSLRVLLRIARHAAGSPEGPCLHTIVHDAMMSRFLPVRLQEAVEGWLQSVEKSPVPKSGKQRREPAVTVDADDVVVGSRRIARRTPRRSELVPAPRSFYASASALLLGS